MTEQACAPKRHPVLLKPHGRKKAAAPLPSEPPLPIWPSFTGTSTFAGTSPSGKVNVWYDATLGDPCLANAQALVADADRIVAFNDGIFGSVGGSTNVIIFALGGNTDGTGGADHMGCDYSLGPNIEVCAAFGQDARVSALYEAELSECSMGGMLCGNSTGEALSRWCSMVVSNDALKDFASAPVWDADGRANWVDTTEPTDQNYDSIGAGMAFLSWLQSKGSTLAQIAQAMVGLGDSGTLAQLYEKLGYGAASAAWTDFTAALATLTTLTAPITSDDPFGGAAPPPPPPPPPPPLVSKWDYWLSIDQMTGAPSIALQAPAGSFAAAPALHANWAVLIPLALKLLMDASNPGTQLLTIEADVAAIVKSLRG